MVELRRRVPRQGVTWFGKCFIDGRFGSWECRVVDVSILGVGLELFGPPPRDVIGGRILADVDHGSISLQLRGIVRHTASGSEGGLRVGLEFTDLSDTERSILDALEQMNVGW